MHRGFRDIGSSLSSAIRWLTTPLAGHPDVRDDMIATVIQRRPAVYISCASVMIMSIAAALLTHQVWAATWLLFDTALIGYRLYLSFRYDDGIHSPTERRGAVVGSMFLLFMVFGIGCSLCIARGSPALMLMAMISVLGVFTGIGSRWAALPRLALVAIALIALPVCVAIALRTGGGLAWAAVQFTAIAVMTCSQTMQNHRTLKRMILAEHQNASLARSDPLTGLGNRTRLAEDLDALLAGDVASTAPRQRAAVLYLDLDDFKAFNDTHGHDAGDALLHLVGQTIRTVADGAGIYRIGGDEFVVICTAPDEAATIDLPRRLAHAVSVVRLPDRARHSGVGASVGMTFVEPGDQPAALLSRADDALYAAKRAGKGRCYAMVQDGTPQSIAA